MIALYVPRLWSGLVPLHLALLLGLAIALVAYLRQRHGVRLAVAFILGGGLVAAVLGILLSVRTDLEEYGDLCRKFNGAPFPDWAFSLYMWFELGRGTVCCAGGMLAASLLLAIGSPLIRRARAAYGSFQAKAN